MAVESEGESASRESVYIVRGNVSCAALTSSLRALLRTRHRPIARHQFTVLDTFDGRVRHAGARLTSTGANGASTVAWHRVDGDMPLTLRLTQTPSFVWEVPSGPLHEALEPVIGVRRLLPQADAEEHGSLLDILDDRRKTVARVRIASGHARLPKPRSAWQPLPTIVTLTALRGYEAAYARLKPVIESRPGVTPWPNGLESVILEHAGAPAGGELPTLRVDLARDVRADAGARQIHRVLVTILLANEPGVRANLDTEFLHDFRVALRRARSLLRQLKHVFSADIVAHFSTEFSWLGQLTGPSRDLDVLGLALRRGGSDVPTTGIDAVIAFIDRAQAAERSRLIDGLDSVRYQTLVSKWQRFLERRVAAGSIAANADQPLVDVVADRAWKLSKRITQKARTIDERTSAAELHEIRINAKKLRYVIDVTSTFYDAGDFESILTSLKKLQRVLGDFNDAQVQSARLIEYGRALGESGGPAGASVALGQLAEERRQRGVRLRVQIADELAHFCAPAIRAACRRAFKREPIQERA